MANQKEPGSPRGLMMIFPLLLSVTGFLNFMLFHRSAFKWPAADMFPFFSRMQDPSFALSDYFTNASMIPNARFIFGYFVIGISRVMGTDWYGSIFLLKTMLVLLMPAAYYFAICLLVRRYARPGSLQIAQAVVTAAILLIMTDRFNSLFAVAWWPPYFIESTSSTLSLILGLAAMIACELSQGIKRWGAVLLFALSTLFHPAIGILCIAFYFIAIAWFIRQEYRTVLAILFFGLILPAAVVTVLFSGSVQLSARSFIDIYVLNNHPFHYHMSDFGSFWPLFNWKTSFALLTVLIIVPAASAAWRKSYASMTLALLLAAAYVSSVAAQYLFIDLFPLKAVAILGPVRFTQFGYWSAVLSWTIEIASRLSVLPVFGKLSARIVNYRIGAAAGMTAGLVLFAVLSVTGYLLRDDPFSTITEKDAALYRFIRNTPQQSVFAVDKSELAINLPVVTGRGVFTGNGFPFSESSLAEFDRRSTQLYGDHRQLEKEQFQWFDEKVNSFYGKLKPSDFVGIAAKYRLDFVVIEKKYTNGFSPAAPVFSDANVSVYSIKDLE